MLANVKIMKGKEQEQYKYAFLHWIARVILKDRTFSPGLVDHRWMVRISAIIHWSFNYSVTENILSLELLYFSWVVQNIFVVLITYANTMWEKMKYHQVLLNKYGYRKI